MQLVHVSLVLLYLAHQCLAKNYAICIHGPSNTIPSSIKTLRANVFDQFDAKDHIHVFYHTFTGNPLPTRIPQTFVSDFQTDHIELLKPKKSFISSQIEFDSLFITNPLNKELMKQYSELSHEEILDIYRSKHALEKLWKIAFGYAAEHSLTYDGVIYLRSDYKYPKPFPMKLFSSNPEEIHLPAELSESTATDGMGLGSIDGMRWFANRHDYELPCEGWLDDKPMVNGVAWNGNRFLQRHLENRNVKIRYNSFAVERV